MDREKVIIIMGSGRDEEFSQRIETVLKSHAVQCESRVASAHKTPQKLLQILEEIERTADGIVYITVAGRSNALSGFVDANTTRPVIACPPYSDSFGGIDIYSSLRMPSGVCPLVILEPENAAFAAIKILGLRTPQLTRRIKQYQEELKLRVEEADQQIQKS